MGATISSRTQGTSVSEHGKGKLEFTPQNEALLNEIVKQVEALVHSHPREAETILKEPFKWHTTLKPDSFGELNFGSMGFQIRSVEVVCMVCFLGSRYDCYAKKKQKCYVIANVFNPAVLIGGPRPVNTETSVLQIQHKFVKKSNW